MSFIQVTKSAGERTPATPLMLNLRYVERIERRGTEGTVISVHHPTSNYDLYVDESFATVAARIDAIQSSRYPAT